MADIVKVSGFTIRREKGGVISVSFSDSGVRKVQKGAPKRLTGVKKEKKEKEKKVKKEKKEKKEKEKTEKSGGCHCSNCGKAGHRITTCPKLS